MWGRISVHTPCSPPLAWGPRDWVEAFEPAADAAERFRCNMALNGFSWVRLTEAAVGASCGAARFTTGLMTVNQIALPGMDRVVEVPQLRLDDGLQARRPAAAKLDIEGAEPLALQGWERSLGEGHPMALMIEINDGIRRFGFEEQAFMGWLGALGYRAGLYDSERRWIRWHEEPWRERENILAIHEPSLGEVLRRIEGKAVTA